jgi:hypothetical protein
MARLATASLALALALVGCRPPAGPATPLAQQALLEVQHVSGECGEKSWKMCTMGVRGCGNSVRYFYFGQNSWVANTQSEGKQPAEKSAPQEAP